jgi:2,3-dihydroxybenzoate decarboxylase
MADLEPIGLTPGIRPGKASYKRIATEEAFAPPELFGIYRRILEEGKLKDPGFESLWGFYLTSPSERTTFIRDHMADVGDKRLAHMDASGIDMQILSLTGPGVQAMDKDEAVGFAAYSNDWIAEKVAAHPDRFAALAACAPQDPAAAAKEIERGISKLGLKGVIINSHTHGEYLDDEKFWPIFEAAEAMDAVIYIHPQGPSKGLIGPLLERGLDGAIYGFSVEVGMHLLRIIVSGAFDRFPKLKIMVGHVGESLPFSLYRIDHMHTASVRSGRYASMPPLKKKPSDYFRENIYATNSGVAWAPPIRFMQEVMGVDRVLYAMDYPYQYVIEEVARLDDMAMDPQAKKAFFQTNAERVFKL